MKLVFFIFILFSLLISCRTLNWEQSEYKDAVVEDVIDNDKSFKVREQDISYLLEMLHDEDPRYRQTAVKLLAQFRGKEYIEEILIATLDDDPAVVEEAYRVLIEDPQWARDYIIDMIKLRNGPLLQSTLYILSSYGDSQSIDSLIAEVPYRTGREEQYFLRSISTSVNYDSSKLTLLIESEEPLDRELYYKIIGKYDLEEVIPILIIGLSDDDYGVRREASFSLIKFKNEAIPYLQQFINNGTEDEALTGLQIIEGIRTPETVPLLLNILYLSSPKLSERALSILGTLGKNAELPLIDALSYSNLNLRVKILDVLGNINLEDDSLLRIIDFFYSDNELEQQAAYHAVINQEDRGVNHLLEIIDIGDEPAKGLAYSALIALGVPDIIVEARSFDVKEERAFYLLSIVSYNQLMNYLDSIAINKMIENDLELLFSVNNIAANYLNLDAERQNSQYFDMQRKREELLSSSQEYMRLSLEKNRAYLTTEDSQLLRESQELREISFQLKEEAEILSEQINYLPLEERTAGQELLLQYQLYQEELMTIWRSISPQSRELASMVFNQASIDITRF